MRDFLATLLSIIFAPSTATRRQRRTLGTVILIAVIFLVFVGSFYLRAGVTPGTSLLFWGICFLLMLWSVFLAYVDVKSIKREFHTQRKKLFLSTFSKPHLKNAEREEDNRRPASSEKSEQPEASGANDL